MVVYDYVVGNSRMSGVVATWTYMDMDMDMDM